MEPSQPQPEPTPKRHSLIGGLVLIVVGFLILLNNLFPEFELGNYWPLILIAIGGGLIWTSRTRN